VLEADAGHVPNDRFRKTQRSLGGKSLHAFISPLMVRK
jgi:hypothetical protein